MKKWINKIYTIIKITLSKKQSPLLLKYYIYDIELERIDIV